MVLCHVKIQLLLVAYCGFLGLNSILNLTTAKMIKVCILESPIRFNNWSLANCMATVSQQGYWMFNEIFTHVVVLKLNFFQIVSQMNLIFM